MRRRKFFYGGGAEDDDSKKEEEKEDSKKEAKKEQVIRERINPKEYFITIMRQFRRSIEKQEECKSSSVQQIKERRFKKFLNESQYMGHWDLFNMSGRGVYTLCNGTKYEGLMKNGLFDGFGKFVYPGQEVIKGIFKEGHLVGDRVLKFGDGLVYSEDNWHYCHDPDRRYKTELDRGLSPKPEGRNRRTTPREIPKGYYDCGYGYFNKEDNRVYQYQNINNFVETPSESVVKWIIDNCESGDSLPVGPIAHLYDKKQEPNLLLTASSSSSEEF